MPVTRFDLSFRRTLEAHRTWGNIGQYEELRGTLHFATDPVNKANTRITDIELAPKNDKGLVEFSSDVSIILPADKEKASNRMILDVVNRGNRITLRDLNRATRSTIDKDTLLDAQISLGDGFLMEQGYVVVACGWQVDAPAIPGLISMAGPNALSPEGGQLVGRVYSQLQSPVDTNNFLLADRGHRPYPAFNLDEKEAVIEVRETPDGPAQILPRGYWRFGRIDENGTYINDPAFICSQSGFKKGLLYQIVYTAIGAPILGLGFAALRDCVSWIKYGSEHLPSPVAGIDRAYAYGLSQTGRLLRTYIYNDFNCDESGRETLDGIICNVAGGMRGEFNQRFGQNSKDRNNMLHQLFPFAPTWQKDLQTKEIDSLHRRIERRKSPLKVIYTNSSAEYYRTDASLVHTDPDGSIDLDLGASVRVFAFAGTEHRAGMWPPTDLDESQNRSRNLRNMVDYTFLLRACLVSLSAWVEEQVDPPPSAHPLLQKGTATTIEQLESFFNGIPGANYPTGHAILRRRQYLPSPENEHPTQLPPKVGTRFGSSVSTVDEDGNETAGIMVPELTVPLATYTGWNLRHPDIGGDQQFLMFAGSTIPLALTKEARYISGDPRLSVEERYASKNDYLTRVRQAAELLVSQRYMLNQDIDPVVQQASRTWDWMHERGTTVTS